MKAYLERFRAWWTALGDRDRRVLSAGAVIAGVLLGYLAVWKPVDALRDRRESALTEARVLAARLEEIAAELQKARGAGGPRPVATNISLLAAVDQSGRASNLGKQPSRMQPEGDAIVKVWIEDVSFDAVLRWLHDLQARYGVRVDTADIERESGAGLVSVRLTLVRGP